MSRPGKQQGYSSPPRATEPKHSSVVVTIEHVEGVMMTETHRRRPREHVCVGIAMILAVLRHMIVSAEARDEEATISKGCAARVLKTAHEMRHTSRGDVLKLVERGVLTPLHRRRGSIPHIVRAAAQMDISHLYPAGSPRRRGQLRAVVTLPKEQSGRPAFALRRSETV